MLNKADIEYNNIISKIHKDGEWDIGEDVRGRYDSDKAPAYTKSIFGHQVSFKNGTVPLITSKKVFVLTAVKEAWLFWIMQTVKEKDFKDNNVKIWDQWFKDGNLGRSYAYQFESHRHQKRELVAVAPIVKSIPKTIKPYHLFKNSDKGTVKNYSEDEINTLYNIWNNMFDNVDEEKTFVHQDWYSFERFLRDIRYLPQFFLAKEEGFEEWVLDLNYYNSNYYSSKSCVWLPREESEVYSMWTEKYESNKRYELSRNQVVELLNGIKYNSQSRRLMTSFWNDADVDKKQLQECAWATQTNIKNNYMDFMLIQRSVDTGLGLPFNWIQYWLIGNLIAHVNNLKFRDFIHQMGNVHYYDRHEDSLLQQIESHVYDTPSISFNREIKDFFDFTPSDIIIDFYESGEHIPLEVSV